MTRTMRGIAQAISPNTSVNLLPPSSRRSSATIKLINSHMLRETNPSNFSHLICYLKKRRVRDYSASANSKRTAWASRNRDRLKSDGIHYCHRIVLDGCQEEEEEKKSDRLPAVLNRQQRRNEHEHAACSFLGLYKQPGPSEKRNCRHAIRSSARTG